MLTFPSKFLCEVEISLERRYRDTKKILLGKAVAGVRATQAHGSDCGLVSGCTGRIESSGALWVGGWCLWQVGDAGRTWLCSWPVNWAKASDAGGF